MNHSIRTDDLERLQLDRGEHPDEVHRIRPDLHPERVARQEKKRRYITSTYVVDLSSVVNVPGVLFPGGVHLPDDMELKSIYIENHGAAQTLQLHAGPAVGFLLTYIKPGYYKRWLFSDGISSATIYTPGADTGLVTVVCSSHKMDPNGGAL